MLRSCDWIPSSTVGMHFLQAALSHCPPSNRGRVRQEVPGIATRKVAPPLFDGRGDGPIDDCLSIRNGVLFIEGCDSTRLAERFGTPIYVMSEDQVRRNFRTFLAEFRRGWPDGPVVVMPSIKANYGLALRRILTDEGAGCDTFGPAELHAALSTGVPPDLISFNGSSKTEELLVRAVSPGVRITLDPGPQGALVSGR